MSKKDNQTIYGYENNIKFINKYTFSVIFHIVTVFIAISVAFKQNIVFVIQAIAREHNDDRTSYGGAGATGVADTGISRRESRCMAGWLAGWLAMLRSPTSERPDLQKTVHQSRCATTSADGAAHTA